MRARRFFVFLLTVALAGSLCLGAVVYAQETEAVSGFSGKRTVEFLVDSSDLDNFVDGGRSMLDLKLRMHSPEWLVTSIRSEGQDVLITLEIPFGSSEEYCLRLSELLEVMPGIMHNEREGLILIEDFHPIRLLDWIQRILDENEDTIQRPLEELLQVNRQVLELNGSVYELDAGAVYIVPAQQLDLELGALEISTSESEKGILTRTIAITTAAARNEDWTDMVDRFEELAEAPGADLKREGRTLQLKFTAYSQQELVDKTMYALGFPVLLTETVTASGNKTQKILRSELYVLDGLMAPDGSFSFVYHCPEHYKDVEPVSIYASVDGNQVTSGGGNLIQFQYECGFRFSGIEIATDYSNLFGKVGKKIIMSSPTAVAVQFHDYIRSTLESRMDKGMTLDIYDQEGVRYYVLSYSSWFAADVEEFAGKVLGNSCKTEIHDSWIPFGKSTLIDRVGTERVMSGKVPAQNVTMRYVLPLWTRVVQGAQSVPVTVQDGAVYLMVGNEADVELVYRRIHPWKTGLELIVLIILAVLVTVIVKKIKTLVRKKDTKKKEKTPKAEKHNQQPPVRIPASPATLYCPNCGTAAEPDGLFCKECGTDLRVFRRGS